MSEIKRKIAVLGGGVGAMTAAYALASLPGATDRFEITVYQMGWRLGGKGASGRNADQGQRIEEHGLHVWSGFYDNAIGQIRQCFADLQGDDGVYQSFEQAFVPHNDIILTEPAGSDWKAWGIRPPMNDEVPGKGSADLSPLAMFKSLIRYVADLIDQSSDADDHAHPATVLSPSTAAHVATYIAPTTIPPKLHHWLVALSDALPDHTAAYLPADKTALIELTRHIHQAAQSRIAIVASTIADDLRRLLMLVDLGAASLRGMIVDGVPFHGFAVVDDHEFSDWLTSHGASDATVDGSLVKAVYDYAFGYRGGQTDRANRAIGAGTFLHGSIRLALTYKGAIFYKMNAGMGDTVFAPYYKALTKRGVRFKFFHQVTGLHLDPTATQIDRIGIAEQAMVIGGSYDPFVRVGALDCWPSRPVWDRLVDGSALSQSGIEFEPFGPPPPPTKTLQRGVDFDDVILGISLGGLAEIAGELTAADPAWRDMLDKVGTVATQAMQLWLRPVIGALGGPAGQPIITSFADAMNTVADMSHVIPAEAWPVGRSPGTIAYFCGPLADDPALDPAHVRKQSDEWMTSNGHKLLPLAFNPDGSLKHQLLLASPEPGKADPWAAQYFRANTSGSERYVLSLPGSARYRLRADRSGFANLWLAGDWTATAINAGCVEAAAMSGLRAAAGLAGVPVRIAGEDANPSGPDPMSNDPVYTAPVLQSLTAQNANWPWSLAYGMTQTTAAVVTLAVPQDLVTAMLPSGLEPGPQSLTPTGLHPVVLFFGRQRAVRPNFFPWGMNYDEFTCTVPWVRHSDPTRQNLPPLACTTKLYLDRLAPILLGIYGYGFPKEKAAILADADSYLIRDTADQSEMIAARFTADGPVSRPHLLNNFAALWPAFEMPLVTRNKFGRWQYSVFDFSLGQARMQPMQFELRIVTSRLGLPQGVFTAPSIATSALGGFFLTTSGTINNPFQSCALLRQMQAISVKQIKP